jgi:hypothetical protein
MRSVACLLILLAIYNFRKGVYDQERGVATFQRGRGLEVQVIAKADDPEGFRNLISHRWTRGTVMLLGGLMVLGIARRSDASDPFSPDFGKGSEPETQDPVLEAELRRRRGGLR